MFLTRKKFPDVNFSDIPFVVIQYDDIDRIFMVKAYGFNYEPVSVEDKQAVKTLAKQLGDTDVENEKDFSTSKCSFTIKNKIAGIKVETK